MRIRHLRSRSGAFLAETAAAVALAVPLCFYALFVAVEACQVYGINQALAQAARAAARNIATIYPQDIGIINNPSDQQNYGFQPVVTDAKSGNQSLANAIGSTSQFSASFNTSTSPGTVTVTVQYISGSSTGLPVFPQIDPLFLGSNYQMVQTSSYNLE